MRTKPDPASQSGTRPLIRGASPDSAYVSTGAFIGPATAQGSALPIVPHPSS